MLQTFQNFPDSAFLPGSVGILQDSVGMHKIAPKDANNIRVSLDFVFGL